MMMRHICAHHKNSNTDFLLNKLKNNKGFLMYRRYGKRQTGVGLKS